MDWDKLRIFHAVAEAGSFTHAGTGLGLSQSAVSRQVASLEQDLKLSLFHRHARGLILTEQGEILYGTVRDVFTRLAMTKARLQDSTQKPTGDLTLTTTVGIGTMWLTPRITEFMEIYPQIDVCVVLEDRDLDLAMREADVAIRMHRPVQPDLIQRRLFTVHNNVYASPEYIRKYGLPKSIEDLDFHSILGFSVVPGYLSEINWLLKIGRRENNPRHARFTINNVIGLRRVVEAGLGIASLPDYIVAPDSKLIRVELPVESPVFDTYLVYPEELRASKRVAVFREFIISRAKQWSF